MALAEPSVVAVAPARVADAPISLVAAATQPRSLDNSFADLAGSVVQTAAGDAPLLDLLDRLLPAKAPHDQVSPNSDGAAAAAINLQGCSMDELWLGDFALEDPRRVSLIGRAVEVLTGLVRGMTLRLGFNRHTMITYRGGRNPLPA